MGNESLGRINRLVVQGHNNRYEKLAALEIEVCGHNNQFSDIYCQSLIDNGQSNKFRNLHQVELAASSELDDDYGEEIQVEIDADALGGDENEEDDICCEEELIYDEVDSDDDGNPSQPGEYIDAQYVHQQ